MGCEAQATQGGSSAYSVTHGIAIDGSELSLPDHETSRREVV
jgi:hypothetical protein